jgi:hypothetical protein
MVDAAKGSILAYGPRVSRSSPREVNRSSNSKDSQESSGFQFSWERDIEGPSRAISSSGRQRFFDLLLSNCYSCYYVPSMIRLWLPI